MRNKIKLTLIMCTAAACLTAYGCASGKKKDNDTQSAVTTTTAENKVNPEKVEIRTYEFPQFMNEFKTPEMLTSLVASGFDPQEHIRELSASPIEGLDCFETIDDVLYIFRDGKLLGIADTEGEVLVEADRYTDIHVCAPGMIELSEDKEQNVPPQYAHYNENGELAMLEDFAFDQANIVIDTVYPEPEEEEEEPAETEPKFEMRFPNGVIVMDTLWDSIEPLSADRVITSKGYSAMYSAKLDKKSYYICVDRYYNYYVYNGVYGSVTIKVGDSVGQCYIVDPEDSSELEKMLQSFGSTDTAKLPSSDEMLDFIRIELNGDAGDSICYTISSEGYCLTEKFGENGIVVSKFFTELDKESFVSLVQWVDQVVSAEYGFERTDVQTEQEN
ncbi:MAG: hypothetical protein IJ737_01880 [Ruminococcus sp.]|nr:hypothetical protein [Ruminococcus sp.]